jgi:hypothetical protein
MRLPILVATLCLAAAPAVALDVWCPGPLETIYEGVDYSGRDDPKCELRLAGTRNGAFSAQAVVFAREGMPGPQATCSDLRGTDGKAVIPAAAIEVRYALPTGGNGIARLPTGAAGIFDALDTKPRDKAGVHPVWITVNVPADAAPGAYEGAVSVAGRSVPVRLHVAPWTLPPPSAYRTWIDFIESPESVALRYGKKLWSDEHWELVGKVWDQLGKVGNKTLYLTLMGQTHFGNCESMVRWIRTGEHPAKAPGELDARHQAFVDANGGFAKNVPDFRHDFSIVEKYLDTRIRHAGKPAVVVLYIYEGFLGGGQGRTPEECNRGVPFTLLDPATGATTNAVGPCHDNRTLAYPDYPGDTIAFWKPVIDGVRERLKARGIGDECITLGISNDMQPGKEQMAYLTSTFPYATWCHEGHGLIGRQGGMNVGYCTMVWMAQGAKSATDRNYGWRKWKHHPESLVVAQFDRDIWKADYPVQLVRGRLMCEMNITGYQRGVGRLSADFWPCLRDDKGRLRPIPNRYPLSDWWQLSVRNTPHLAAGEAGPLATIRFEMVREGIQECEARIAIEKVLRDPATRARLGEPLAARVQAVLDARMLDDKGRAEMIRHLGGGASEELRKTCSGYAASGWQAASTALYTAAHEVTEALAAPAAK